MPASEKNAGNPPPFLHLVIFNRNALNRTGGNTPPYNRASGIYWRQRIRYFFVSVVRFAVTDVIQDGILCLTGGNAFRTQKHERNCSEAHQKNSPANISQGQYRTQWHTYILKASHQFGSCRNFLQAKERFVIRESCKHEMECVEQDRR